MPADRPRTLAARWMILGEWRAHPMRAVTAAVAIAVGVALGLAVHLVNASALNEFSQAVSTVNGDAELQVRGVSPAGFDEDLYPTLARLPGVAAASPVVELTAGVKGAREPVTLIGLDVLRAAYVTPSLLGRPAGADTAHGPTSEAAFDDNAVLLSQAALEALKVKTGDRLDLTAAGRTVPLRVSGTLPGVAEGQQIAVMDIAAAQWRFGQIGKLQRIDLRIDQGADAGRVRSAIAEVLPADAQLVSRESEARRSDALSRAYRVNLDMLALMALLTGGFLVYSAQSLAVARRRAQFALLRVLGVRRRALLGQVLAEGAVVGIAGGIAGLGLGLALASGVLALLGGDLGGGYFGGVEPELVFAPGAALVFLVLGLLTAMGGSLIPAREAARAQPAVALKNVGDAVDPRVAPRIWPSVLLLAAGAAAAFAPAVGGIPLFGYGAMALLLAGGVAAMPWIARTLLTPLQRVRVAGAAVDLAFKRLWGAPSQAAVALCGIVASTSLMVAMAVMVSSFRGSVDDWLGQVLADDLYIRAEVSGGGFDPATQAALTRTPGVARMVFQTSTSLRLSPDQPPLAVLVRPFDARRMPMINSAAPPAGATPVWVSEPAAWLYGWKPGQSITLPISGKAAPFFVAGIWRDYSNQHGAVALDSADYTRLTGDAFRAGAAVELAPGAKPQTVIAALRAQMPPGLSVDFAEPKTLRAFALRLFDRSFAVTYGLEAIAILVGLAGVAATVSAQTLARTKEFGMLRHLGVTRSQIVAMLATEGAVLGAVGVVAGIGLGLVMSQVLIHVVNPQSFHWTMETQLPWPLLVGVAISLVAAAAGTALLAGRRALSADAVRAVREDW